MKRIVILSTLAFCILSFMPSPSESDFKGAYTLNNESELQVILFIDGYFTHTVYRLNEKEFRYTRGGTFKLDEERLEVVYEFDSRDKEQVGKTVRYELEKEDDGSLEFDINGEDQKWLKIDEGDQKLAGLWTITGRQQNGKLVTIHQTGTRKTIKILSGTRFQWAAIDPGTKSFMGSGGGSYTFENGKYTENIEFFSRDNSRVGQSLSFDGKIENGDWHHSGLSSKGDPIYEVWSRKH